MRCKLRQHSSTIRVSREARRGEEEAVAEDRGRRTREAIRIGRRRERVPRRSSCTRHCRTCAAATSRRCSGSARTANYRLPLTLSSARSGLDTSTGSILCLPWSHHLTCSTRSFSTVSHILCPMTVTSPV
uniref:Uncharacterized protein n=1 Tax=Cacopsylla melanoneura TaxID=428564 RepID=A0A8D8WKT0_9HEMI